MNTDKATTSARQGLPETVRARAVPGAAPVPPATGTRARDDFVTESLRAWRTRAVGIFTTALAVAYLPAMLLLVFGDFLTLSRPMETLALGAYTLVVALALLPRLDARLRMWTVLMAGYVFAVAGSVAVPNGPFPRSVASSLPILALVLLGPRSARCTTAVSVLVLVGAPFLGRIPGLSEFLAGGGAGTPAEPTGKLLTQGAGLAGRLVGLMLLLDWFHQFLMGALTAQHEASEKARREAEEREAANRHLAKEIDERRRLEREIARIGEEERQRLGRDVHDGVCQQLTGAMLRCRALEMRLGRGESLATEDVRALAGLLEETIDEAHAVAKGLCPLDSSDDALVTALQTLARRTQRSVAPRCEFRADGTVQVRDPSRAQHLFRIAQEAVSNAVRHAQARHIVLELAGDEHELVLRVEDDGIGLPAEVAGTGMGLRTMRHRARILDGELAVTPGPRGGTRIVCRVPRQAGHPPTESRHAS